MIYSTKRACDAGSLATGCKITEENLSWSERDVAFEEDTPRMPEQNQSIISVNLLPWFVKNFLTKILIFFLPYSTVLHTSK